jgi:folate-binding protein YgfZ
VGWSETGRGDAFTTGYAAATGEAAIMDRSHRVRMVVTGRAPAQMLLGLITGRIPAPATPDDQTLSTGTASYSAVLTAKGRMVTDLRVFSLAGGQGRLLLEVPEAGAQALAAHFTRYVPPRMARQADVSGATAMLTVMGPDAAGLIAELIRPTLSESLAAMGELEYVQLVRPETETADEAPADAAESPFGVLVVRTADVAVPAFDILTDTNRAQDLLNRFISSGAVPVEQDVWETLRVEAGRPAFGVDMLDDTLPPEAGIQDRAIDHTKGCYTGQEVIVRIRDRGHVNRSLRGLILGDAPIPPGGTQLFDQAGQSRGRITSAVRSPRKGGGVGLGYVRREIEPPAELHLGAADGPVVEVRELVGADWSRS